MTLQDPLAKGILRLNNDNNIEDIIDKNDNDNDSDDNNHSPRLRQPPCG